MFLIVPMVIRTLPANGMIWLYDTVMERRLFSLTNTLNTGNGQTRKFPFLMRQVGVKAVLICTIAICDG